MENTSVRTRDGGVTHLEYGTLNDFRSSLEGKLISPADEGYDAARKVWNGMIDRKPGVIVRCAGAADVMKAVRFAAEHNLLLSVRSGGHNVAGSAVAEDGFVIDLSEMQGVHVDPEQRVAHVEGGARLGDVDQAAQAFGLATPLGVVSATGVAGLTLHGGAGWMLRKHGLSIDNLLSVDIVTADGRLHKVSESKNPDLFWAIRGGGGNFGIVTAFDFKLHPVGPQVWMAVPMYPLERAGEVMGALQDIMADASEHLGVLGVFWSAPNVPEVPAEWRGAPVVILLGCYTGPFEEGERAIAPLRTIGKPVADLSAPMSWVEAQQFLDGDYPDGAFYYWKSIYLDRLDKDIIEALAKHTRLRPSGISSIDVWMLGGAVSRIPPTATAFFRREAPFMLGIEANWEEREEAEANIAWARHVFEDMKRFTGSGVYLNFPGFVEDREALLEAAYGSNLERLRAIKTKYDPANLFPGMLNIEPQVK